MEEKRTVWDRLKENEQGAVKTFSEGYRQFLSKAKTERQAASYIEEEARKLGFRSIEEYSSLSPGAKVYQVFRGKSLCLAVIGKSPLQQGFRLIGSHLDSPRLDFKQNPLYEETSLALCKTHYYGGIKKYQWATMPLALHGVVFTEQGQKIEISIGENEGDPVFTITDLLPHLAKDQMDKKTREAFSGEGLNIIVGSIPATGDEKDRVKAAICQILQSEYGIKTEDFVSAELEAVPAGPARLVGLDRSMIGGYGQDDRACVYTSLMALFDVKNPDNTVICLFVDKEEIGSDGATGMKSRLLEDFMSEVSALLQGVYNSIEVRRCLRNSMALSADITGAFDPNFPDVSDKLNTAYLGNGVVISKYSGVGGKYEANDANAEFLAYVRRVFNKGGVVWQTGEMGKVDQGGGGTIAQYMARYGMEVLDCGPALLSVHSPFEVASIADIYMTYKAYCSFFTL